MRNTNFRLRNVVKIGVACLAVTTMFFACKKDVKVTSVVLDKTALTLDVGDTVRSPPPSYPPMPLTNP